MDSRVAALIEDLQSPDEARADGAREGLDALGAAAVPDLLPLLRDSHERVRAAALGVVARHGDGSPAVAREVLRGAQAALRSFEHPDAAAEVHEAILGLEGPVLGLAPMLLADLGAAEDGARLAAARDLETLSHYFGAAGAEETALLDALRGALRDPEGRVRWWAAGALGNLALDPARSVPALSYALDDAEPVIRLAALEALERFGTEAAPALPSILPFLAAEDGAVAARAAVVAARVGRLAGGVHAALLARVADPRPEVRTAACAALGELGNAPREALEALAAALKDPEEDVRRAAGWALQRIRMIHGS